MVQPRNYLIRKLLVFLMTGIFVLAIWQLVIPHLSIPGKADETTNIKDLSNRTPSPTYEISLDVLIPRLESLGPINSILIRQDGSLIVEEYFRGMHSERANNIKSASKSILSILTGIAIDKGYLEGVDQTIEKFFPEYFDETRDAIKASITIGDLLTMRAGLQSTSGRNYGRWVTSNDWVRYVLDRPLEGEPGVQRIYSTGTTHLLAVILARATGMSTLAFANRYLFEPMDIRVAGWDRDPQGNYLGGNNMALRPLDMIKIGQMMMDMGVYNKEQIVSPEWILMSIEPVTGRKSVNEYGYLWFRRMAGDYHVIYAWGNGGQFITIIPELDAVIAITSQNLSGSTRAFSRQLMSTIDNDIVPYLEFHYPGFH